MARGVYPAAALAVCCGVFVWWTRIDASLTVAPLRTLSVATQSQYLSTSSCVSVMSAVVGCQVRWHFGVEMLSLPGLGGGNFRRVVRGFVTRVFSGFVFLVAETLVSKTGLRMPLTPLLAEI